MDLLNIVNILLFIIVIILIINRINYKENFVCGGSCIINEECSFNLKCVNNKCCS